MGELVKGTREEYHLKMKFLGMITLLGNEDHEDMVVEARGDSHEEAMVNAIAEWNKKYT